MSKNIRVVDEDNCTGCGVCAEICPKSCITMKEDADGFSVPHLEEAYCLNCGKCLKSCPAINITYYKNISSYAAVCKDLSTVLKSSSGGMFPLLSKKWIEEGGYICAARMMPNYEVQHCLTNRLEDIPKFQGSKYVQSYVFRCYDDMKTILSSGKKILFFGTPCQVQGIKLLFSDFSEQLCGIDLICHGVPSPLFFRKHIEREYKRDNSLEIVCFREKTKFETNIYRLVMKEEYKEKRVYAMQDAYYATFLEGKSFRESCYRCKFAKAERCGDITIGDCATTSRYKCFPYGTVLSTVLINTEKGIEIWKKISNNVESCSLDILEEIRLNHQLHEASLRPEVRDVIYDDWKEMSREVFNKKYTHRPDIKEYTKRVVKRLFPVSVRKLILRGLRR